MRFFVSIPAAAKVILDRIEVCFRDAEFLLGRDLGQANDYTALCRSDFYPGRGKTYRGSFAGSAGWCSGLPLNRQSASPALADWVGAVVPRCSR
jgi:hypothetical protein